MTDHQSGIEAAKKAFRRNKTPGLGVEAAISAYLSTSKPVAEAVKVKPEPVGYVTGSNLRAMKDGLQGVMIVSNVENALFSNPIYAIPPEIQALTVESIIAIRDALIGDDIEEAYYQLYKAVDPDFCRLQPWAEIEAAAALSTPPQPEAQGDNEAERLRRCLETVRANLVRLAWEENSIMIEGIDAALRPEQNGGKSA
jgi:hypothetical protein